MSTVYLVADWVTLLYFCLSTMFAAIILLFFFGKKLGLMRFAAVNWGIREVRPGNPTVFDRGMKGRLFISCNGGKSI